MIRKSFAATRFRPTSIASRAYASSGGAPLVVTCSKRSRGRQRSTHPFGHAATGASRRPGDPKDPWLIAPVEVPGAAPETLVRRRRLDAVRLGVCNDEVLLGLGDGHVSVQRVLDARLLLGLEQRVILE